ncbi:unnamed protein product [marine sediment metagenome]|uniref:Uncharacterized protein n=1 Tax=marine sediment metagenome TaxID=412755 RepID=X1CV20_9ZZZZ
MGKDTIIVLSDGSKYKLTPKAIKFIEDLKTFFAERGIPEEKIPLYLEELARREREGNL